MVHHPIVQTDLWNTYADIFLVIDSFQDALIFPGHHYPPDLVLQTIILLIHYPPDLNPSDCFLSGCHKERIYNNDPKTLADLKDSIKSEIMKISIDMIKRVTDNFNTRIGAVIRPQGARIEYIINY